MTLFFQAYKSASLIVSINHLFEPLDNLYFKQFRWQNVTVYNHKVHGN